MLVFLLAALENDEDKKLFTEIYEQYRPQMERTAMHFLKSHADVEDAVQNAFMQMIRHFEKIYEIPCEELSFWIISIVKNEALSFNVWWRNITKKKLSANLYSNREIRLARVFCFEFLNDYV